MCSFYQSYLTTNLNTSRVSPLHFSNNFIENLVEINMYQNFIIKIYMIL